MFPPSELEDDPFTGVQVQVAAAAFATQRFVAASQHAAPGLLYNAKSVILAHNHPSGDPKPSQEDIETTRLFSNTLAGLGIMIMDHIIIGKNDFASLKQMGIFPDDTKVREPKTKYLAVISNQNQNASSKAIKAINVQTR